MIANKIFESFNMELLCFGERNNLEADRKVLWYDEVKPTGAEEECASIRFRLPSTALLI